MLTRPELDVRQVNSNIFRNNKKYFEILGSYGEFATFGYLAFVVTIATTGQ